MDWTIIFIAWLVLAFLFLALIYGSSPRRSYCVEDELEDDQEQLDYLDKWSRK